MKCNEVENKIEDYLEGSLSAEEKTAFEQHLSGCDACKLAVKQTEALLATIRKVTPEVPDEKLKYSFEHMLQTEKQLVAQKKEPKVIALSWKTAFQVAASVLLLIAGYMFGESQAKQKADTQITYLEQQSEDLKTEMTLAMLDNRSASKRIQAVSYSEEMKQPDVKVLEAIISRMHNDENVNVRLTAAEALGRFKDNTLVKDAFIKALTQERNPDVQIAVIEFLAQAQDKRAVEPMQKLLQEPEVPGFVKQQATNGLTQML